MTLVASTARDGHTVVELDATAMVWDGPDLPLRPADVTRVELGPGDALVAVELATICGSDLHTLAGHRPGPVPSVLGHETVGSIVALGPGRPAKDVRGRTPALGDRVAVGIYAACGECLRCRSGREQKCETLFKYGHVASSEPDVLTGGYASHLHVRRGTPLVRVDAIPAAVAAPLGCATATAVACVAAALTDGGPPIDLAVPSIALAGVRATVTGAGLVGLIAAALLADHGACVTVVDPHADRRSRAIRFGASSALAPGEPTLPADVFLELSGSPAAAGGAIDATAIGGTVVLAGTVSPGVTLGWDAETLVRRLITVRGVHNYRPADLAAAARWSERALERLPLHELAGPTFPLKRVDAAIDAAHHSSALRVGITAH